MGNNFKARRADIDPSNKADTQQMEVYITETLMEEDTQLGRYLTFSLGRESFGLEITFVREIVGMQPITEIPEVKAYVKGVINLRGRIIPVIDMSLMFGFETGSYTDRTCIIIVDIQDISIGLIVDNVSEVLTIGDENIVPPPPASTGATNPCIKAIGKTGSDVKLLLDCERLFEKDKPDLANIISED